MIRDRASPSAKADDCRLSPTTSRWAPPVFALAWTRLGGCKRPAQEVDMLTMTLLSLVSCCVGGSDRAGVTHA
jgi:hypothetical protein